MTLSSMVVSKDWPEISVLECIMGGLHIGVDVETDPARARTKLATSKIDALIVDCDLSGTSELLGGLEKNFFHNTVPLVIIGNSTAKKNLQESEGTFVFQKPISVDQAVRTFSAARNTILQGRLRYHRQPLDTTVSVAYGRKQTLKAHLLNLSQNGLRMRTPQPIPGDRPVRVNFALPGTKQSFKFCGEVVWQKQSDAGIQFASTEGPAGRNLQLWLERQYLTN
ncbi:MAG TPA: PilZ domain-containing protein [Terriglobales bacterium]|nr:PilZ domain-containing protein [Terriglobales bacterium]